MAELDKDELRILDAIEMNLLNTRAGLRQDLHPAWDRLVAKNLIQKAEFFVLTGEGKEAHALANRPAGDHGKDER